MPNLLNPYVFPPYVGPFDLVGSGLYGFSLRRLSSTYSGPCMQVRRLSDNATQDIGFVDNFVDTAAILAFCTSQTGEVNIWYDQSGSGNDIYGAAAGASPIICQVGSISTNTFNGQYAVNTPDGQNIKTVGSLAPTVLTTWTVCLQATETFRYIFKATGSGISAGSYVDNVTNRIAMTLGSAAIGNGTTIPINSPMLFQAQYNGASSFYNVNGVAGGTLSGTVGTNSIGQLSIGLDWTPYSNYQEFIGWGSVLNGTQITQIQNNINNYYTIY